MLSGTVLSGTLVPEMSAKPVQHEIPKQLGPRGRLMAHQVAIEGLIRGIA
jgi:hypothetical protein